MAQTLWSPLRLPPCKITGRRMSFASHSPSPSPSLQPCLSRPALLFLKTASFFAYLFLWLFFCLNNCSRLGAFANFPFLPDLHFQFPFLLSLPLPFTLPLPSTFRLRLKRILRIYPINNCSEYFFSFFFFFFQSRAILNTVVEAFLCSHRWVSTAAMVDKRSGSSSVSTPTGQISLFVNTPRLELELSASKETGRGWTFSSSCLMDQSLNSQHFNWAH